MEVMEEGDLMDRVPILLNRDKQYYQDHQTVLQETICAGIVGGKLDFPRNASFAAVKIVHWWEDEYYAAYKKNSGLLHMDELNDDDDDIGGGRRTTTAARVIVKDSDPEKFVGAITKTADKLLEHIHTLSQEALDHADLTVLTAYIGAAALVKNSLWVYLNSVTKNIYPPKGDEPGGSMKLSHQQFAEMTEALAERLLDLHTRLLTLYIMQDADCLNWESAQPFFESERGSYTVQMWWLYMQGTKENLWNSVPPNMAQRVLAGMLNDTLGLLTVRYTQTVPSAVRAPLLLTDVCNMLLCVSEILPAICDSGEAYVGLNIGAQSKIVRDVHAKCQELFTCLLLRGVPLGTLFKCMQKGAATVKMFGSRNGLPAPWIVFALPRCFGADAMPSGGGGGGGIAAGNNSSGQWATSCRDFSASTAIAIELKVLLNSPQANWSLLVRILLMRDATLTGVILRQLLDNVPPSDCFVATLELPFMRRKWEASKCEGFLCGKECNDLAEWIGQQSDPIGQNNYQTVLALCYVVILTGKTFDINATIVRALDKSVDSAWASCLDRRQVWNQKRPPWFEAILYFVYAVLDPIVHMLVVAMQTGGTMYQAMALAISCLAEMSDCVPSCLYTVTNALTEILPTDVKPLGGSVLIQTLFAALYTKLLENIQIEDAAAAAAATAAATRAGSGVLGRATARATTSTAPLDGSKPLSRATLCGMLAEAICSIDEDNKHTEALEGLIRVVRDSQRSVVLSDDEDCLSLADEQRADTVDADGCDDDDDDEADEEHAGLSFVSTVKLDDLDGQQPADRRMAPTPSTRTAAEYDVDNADYIAELLASDVLANYVGKQCLKHLYTYLRNNAEWLLQQLGCSDIPLSPLQPLPGQSVRERRANLLHQMFHIGHQPFDQLLTSALRIDYGRWLQTPLSLTPDRAWLQISKRPEFQESVRLSVQDAVMVASVREKCK